MGWGQENSVQVSPLLLNALYMEPCFLFAGMQWPWFSWTMELKCCQGLYNNPPRYTHGIARHFFETVSMRINTPNFSLKKGPHFS